MHLNDGTLRPRAGLLDVMFLMLNIIDFVIARPLSETALGRLLTLSNTSLETFIMIQYIFYSNVLLEIVFNA